jgi:hypothetical protein
MGAETNAPNFDAKDQFVFPLGTGMDKAPAGTGTEFTSEETELFLRRLDAYDRARNRAAVEIRSIPLLSGIVKAPEE